MSGSKLLNFYINFLQIWNMLANLFLHIFGDFPDPLILFTGLVQQGPTAYPSMHKTKYFLAQMIYLFLQILSLYKC